MRQRAQPAGQTQDDLYRSACSPGRMVKSRTTGAELSTVTSEASNEKSGYVRQFTAPFWGIDEPLGALTASVGPRHLLAAGVQT